MSYVLGIDLGTSSLKGILMNKNGDIIISSSYNYPIITLKSSYSEQNLEVWIEALQKIIENISENIKDFNENLEAISFSGQMHSLVLLGEDDKVLRNAILWNDVRNTKECNYIMENKDEIINITKNIALEGFTLPKILWVQKYEKEIFEKVKHILLPKDYLVHYFTGKYCTDYSDASGTLLLDMNTKNWSKKILEKYNIPIELLPDLKYSTEEVSRIRKKIKEKFKFKKDVKIFPGGADNACAALSAGIIDDEIGMVSVGTSGVFLSLENNIDKYKGELHVFNHVVDNLSYKMGVTLSAGYSLDWFRKTFAKNLDFNELLENIDSVAIGSNGLIFTPYIMGERTPYIDSKIRGSFIGIDVTHNINDFTRSVIEGIIFSLKDSQRLMEKLSTNKIKYLISLGGVSKNKKSLQIQANIFNLEIKTLKNEANPCIGAAMIAMLGLKWFENTKECVNKIIKYGDVYTPEIDKVRQYEKIYEVYTKIYNNTKKICHSISQLRE